MALLDFLKHLTVYLHKFLLLFLYWQVDLYLNKLVVVFLNKVKVVYLLTVSAVYLNTVLDVYLLTVLVNYLNKFHLDLRVRQQDLLRIMLNRILNLLDKHHLKTLGRTILVLVAAQPPVRRTLPSPWEKRDQAM